MILQLSDEQNKELVAEIGRISKKYKADPGGTLDDLLAVLDQQYKEIDLIIQKYEREYIDRFKGNKEALQEDAVKQLSMLVSELHEKPEVYQSVKDGCGIESYLTAEISMYLQALDEYPEAVDRLTELIKHAETHFPADPVKVPEESIIRRSALPAVQRFGIMNDKLAHLLPVGDYKKSDEDGEPVYLMGIEQASAVEKKKNISVPVYITMTGADDMEVSKPVTALDLAVISAVGSVYHAVKKQNPAQEVYVTTAEIWRLLNGYAINDATAKPHDKQLARIQKSIEKQSVNRVSIDFTAEAERRQLEIDGERIKKGILKGNMLQTQAVEIETEKRQRIVSYKIMAEPILYRYNATKKNLQLVDPDLLQTGRYLKETAGVIEVRLYLINQIQLMKDKKRNNKRILINTIYEKTGLQKPEKRVQPKQVRKARAQDRQKLEAILKALKAKHFINGYKTVTEGNTITGYDILL